MTPDLYKFFNELNAKWFDGALPEIELYWNSRLRASAGRFYPGVRKRRIGIFSRPAKPPYIEIAHYLIAEERGEAIIRDTLAHEMIHYWLWFEGKDHGHTGEFLKKMRSMGVPRYNPVPKVAPPKYVYVCPACAKRYPARRRWKTIACASCCKTHSGGKYDPRFALVIS